MILMFENGFMDRIKHGVGVEGEGTWKYGPILLQMLNLSIKLG